MTKSIYFNHIYIIQSLPLCDKPTGKTLYDEVLQYSEFKIPGLISSFHNVESKAELLSVLSSVSNETDNQIMPFLHFEMHGKPTGLVLSNGEFISWEELYHWFVQINGKTQHNLFVSIAACYGAYIFNIIQPIQRAPFFCFVGPVNEVKGSSILIDFTSFFTSLLSERDINTAVEKINEAYEKSFYMAYTSEMVFDLVYQKWRAQYESNDYKSDKLRQLSERARAMGIALNRQQLREQLKDSIKEQPSVARKIKAYFLFKSNSRDF